MLNLIGFFLAPTATTICKKLNELTSMFHFRKSYWAPDGQGGYKESTLVDGDIEKEGAKCTVMIGHEVIMSREKKSNLDYFRNI